MYKNGALLICYPAKNLSLRHIVYTKVRANLNKNSYVFETVRGKKF